MACTPPSDDDLLKRFAAGDRVGLEELFRRYRGVAYRVAYRLLGNEVDALDAVQDGFVNALTHLEKFRGQSSFKTWLMRVVSNASLDLGRKRKRAEARSGGQTVSDDTPVPEDLPGPGSQLERADLRAQLNAALQELPEAQRETFVLHAEGDLTYREVAEVLGISIGTVMSRVFYARQRLKVLLADQVLP